MLQLNIEKGKEMTLKIIGAGFGRTGTESTKAALELLLQGKCYHMKEILEQSNQLEYWHEFALSKEREMNWQEVLKDYVATLDWPACNYYKELMIEYPEAKVLLTYREPEKWFASYLTLVKINKMVNKIAPMVPKFKKFKFMIQQVTWHIFSDIEDKEHCIDVYLRHIEEVKAHVPEEQLLIFEVKDGWEPLCNFLGVEIPDKPFPHLNTRGELLKNVRRYGAIELLKANWKRLLILIGLIITIIKFRRIFKK